MSDRRKIAIFDVLSELVALDFVRLEHAVRVLVAHGFYFLGAFH